MKILIAGILSVVSLSAQARGGGALTRALGAVTPVSSSLTRPLGGVAFPMFGQPSTVRRTGGARTGTRYVGPIYYVPNAFGGYDYSSYPMAGYGDQAAQPLVVNQYFISKGSSLPDVPEQPQVASNEASLNPGDPLGEPQNYYLIAYKDRSMYSALAYWIEGDTLHYVTTQNTHNQASLSLIDVDRTYKLNSERSVPFAVPGR